MGLLQEFREFAVKGNFVDMAVGIVIGAGFGKIVSSFVNDVITPITGLFLGGTDLTGLALTLKENHSTDAEGQPVDLMMNYGTFLQTVTDFVIVAFAVFIVVKLINTAKSQFEKEQEEAKEEAPSAEVQLLTEIRDSLQQS